MFSTSSTEGVFGGGYGGDSPMMMGSPSSPASPIGHQSQFLPGYLMGDSMSHSPGPSLWSASSPSPPKSAQRGSSLTSPSTIGPASRPRNEILRHKERVGAPPTKGLLVSPTGAMNSSLSGSTHVSNLHPKTPGMGTPGTSAPPTAGLSYSLNESVTRGGDDVTHSFLAGTKLPTSPAQLDPFYTQGENLTSDDSLDDTWVTVFGFPPAAASFILQQFSQYGNILRHVVSSEGNWMHLHYQSKLQAKKALSKNSKIFGNSIMIGVSPCIDKTIIEQNKDNDVNSYMENPANISVQGNMSMAGAKNTPIRPLTAAYRSAKSENEVVRNNQAPQKTNTFVGKAMEYMFGW